MSEMDKKNTIYIGIILVVLLITCAFSFTFAFIGGATSNGNINVIGNVLDASNAITLGYPTSDDTELTLNITLDDLSILDSSNDYTSYIESTTTVDIVLQTDSNYYPSGALCTYNINYVPTVTYIPSAASVANLLMELTIQGNSYGVSGGSTTVEEKSLANVSSQISLGTGYLIGTTSATDSEMERWTFKMRYYNLAVNQNDAIGQTPSGKIVIVPGECEKL